ncbi:gliding motility protein GldN [Hymenobacter setariae]|uniref:Gliding motility protein GldN n=1 Tax=Hymenobacter setariae TaxID=2594794 RepID=A0A558BXX0_9BACT|nr:gliding motility protein GldN [Hymenobacter setariae]TVT41365.1 gliding motility protein GldN [Hymenobacter setariae]
MTRYFKILPFTLAALTASVAAHAQEQAAATATTGAVRAIPVSDQMFRKTIWRAIDLREKQNLPMYSDGREIGRVIIDAVKRGELQAYKNDSVTSTLTAKEMSANMSYAIEAPISADGDDWGAGAPPAKSTKSAAAANDGWGAPVASPKKPATKRVAVLDSKGKPVKKNGKQVYRTVPVSSVAVAPPPPKTSEEYRPKDLYQMELSEEMIFDKKRSRMYHQIKTISLKLPSTLATNTSGLEKNVATFKYSDLVKVFRNNPQTAIWFNAQNDAQHKNLADAFELWLFNSYITKVSNPAGDDLASQYGGERQGLLASQQIAADLVEYEYNLWSF